MEFRKKESKKRKNDAGFTMMELLFALSIWVLGFTAVIGVFQLVINAGGAAKDRLIAANLAQEGVEIVHNIRDSSYNKGKDWDSGFISDCFNSNCEVDYQSTSTLTKSTSTVLGYASTTGAYGYFPSGPDVSPSPFKRHVEMVKDYGTPCSYASSSECIQVKVEVTWQRKGKEKSVEVENYIFDWD